MDVHTWIANDLQSVRSKLSDSVLSVVPMQRWVEQVDDGGSSIAHVLLHIARHHHERWDGKGYPHGLAGESIPIGARILTIVDYFDALITDRPYRRALTRV